MRTNIIGKILSLLPQNYILLLQLHSVLVVPTEKGFVRERRCGAVREQLLLATLQPRLARHYRNPPRTLFPLSSFSLLAHYWWGWCTVHAGSVLAHMRQSYKPSPAPMTSSPQVFNMSSHRLVIVLKHDLAGSWQSFPCLALQGEVKESAPICK